MRYVKLGSVFLCTLSGNVILLVLRINLKIRYIVLVPSVCNRHYIEYWFHSTGSHFASIFPLKGIELLSTLILSYFSNNKLLWMLITRSFYQLLFYNGIRYGIMKIGFKQLKPFISCQKY